MSYSYYSNLIFKYSVNYPIISKNKFSNIWLD